jgi:hypothetical protein
VLSAKSQLGYEVLRERHTAKIDHGAAFVSAIARQSGVPFSMETSMSDNSDAANAVQRPSGNASSSAPKRYSGFDSQYIGGVWRHGKEGGKLIDTDPYTGKTLTEIVQPDGSHLNEAYRAAAEAQRSWAAKLPAEKKSRRGRAPGTATEGFGFEARRAAEIGISSIVSL